VFSVQLTPDTLQELLDYHYDRRERLYGFLGALAPAEFVQPMHVGWGNIRNTLVHCLEAEDFWVQHVLQKGARPDYAFEQYPDVAAVRRLAAAVRERTLRYVSVLSEEALSRTASVTYSSGTVVEFTVAKLFLHVITHDTHHRGQVAALARQLNYEPPELDLM
jgi:uncharacterized damage-inducible protein DinB